jgi:hypothetical protein
MMCNVHHYIDHIIYTFIIKLFGDTNIDNILYITT